MLIAMWRNTDLATDAMAAQLGLTKNMVIGKLHRLGLSAAERPYKSKRRRSRARTSAPAPSRRWKKLEPLEPLEPRSTKPVAQALPWEPIAAPSRARLMAGR